MIVMAAAGNQVRIVIAPARFDECIAVAATGEDDEPWSGSSRGGAVLISAPGHKVPAARGEKGLSPSSLGNKIGLASGTSYAVAHLAGIAALWLSFHGRDALLDRYGNFGLQEAFVHILATEGFRRPDGWDTGKWGVGIVDAEKVLAADLPDQVVTTEAAALTESAADRVLAMMSDNDGGRDGLCDLLGCPDDELDELLRVHGPEIAYALGEAETRSPDDPELGPESAPEPINLRDRVGNSPLSPQLRQRVARS